MGEVFQKIRKGGARRSEAIEIDAPSFQKGTEVVLAEVAKEGRETLFAGAEIFIESIAFLFLLIQGIFLVIPFLGGADIGFHKVGVLFIRANDAQSGIFGRRGGVDEIIETHLRKNVYEEGLGGGEAIAPFTRIGMLLIKDLRSEQRREEIGEVDFGDFRDLGEIKGGELVHRGKKRSDAIDFLLGIGRVIQFAGVRFVP